MFLRHLASHWLRREAAKAAKRSFAEAASQQQHENPSTPCEIAILLALGIEAGGLIDLLSGAVKRRAAGFVVHEGDLEGRRTLVVESGPGREKAAAATRAILAGHHPTWVISAGFCGGLTELMQRGDLLLPNRLLAIDGQRLSIDIGISRAPGIHVGSLVTVDHIVRTPSEKKQLAQQTGAIAVDMETLAVAKVCQEAKVRMFAVRAISDTLDDQLPADLEHLMNQSSMSGRLGAAAGSLFRKPGRIKDLWNLREQAILASDRLAKFLADTIPTLPSESSTPD